MHNFDSEARTFRSEPRSRRALELATSYPERKEPERKEPMSYFPMVISGVAGCWFLWREPITFVVFAVFGLAFYSLWKIADYFPFLKRVVGIKIGYGHVVAATMTLTILLSAFETPSYAIFLDGLEKYIGTTLTTSGSTIDPAAVTLVFNAIRIIFLLLVAAAALFAFNQAQQGNDWRPIATQVGMAIGIVLVIDVITFMFIGGGAGNGG